MLEMNALDIVASDKKIFENYNLKPLFDNVTYLCNRSKSFKDARSVSLFPYKRSQSFYYICMLSILNKLTLYKELQTFVTNYVFLDKKVKTQQQQNKKSNIKTLAGAGD